MKNTPLRYLKGIGPRREIIFNKMGIYSLKDLLYYFPFRYQDRRNFKDIKDLKAGEFALIKGKIRTVNLKKLPYFMHSRKVKSIFEVILDDATASVKCAWFNQAYLADKLKAGTELVAYGKLYVSKNGPQIVSPEYEAGDGNDSLGIGRIIGIYRLPYFFNQKFMRKIILSALNSYKRSHTDPIPFHIRKEKEMPNIARSLEEIHSPTSWEAAEKARERFIFEELFLSQILVYLRKAKHRLQKGLQFKIRPAKVDKLKSILPFKLTPAQAKVLSQILNDLAKPCPMHRLLQGEVGCGKTIIAVFAILACIDNNLQAALMVPTEVLAYQHKETLDTIFRRLGILKARNSNAIRVITSSLSSKEQNTVYKNLKRGTIKIVVGTHSLIQERVEFKRLGLVVIDEQHRFGVAQRALLPQKGKVTSHCLVMSATPIPRSLALSLYGDLDLSVINDKPAGRLLPQTSWVKERKRRDIYNFIEEKLKEGRQAYIIYPVIGPSHTLRVDPEYDRRIDESQTADLQSLKNMYGKVAKRFSAYSVKMFHGRMHNGDKIKTIRAFKEKKVDILVCTTVVEVGVNIENASVMMVENPERFGLAQLHQLRGRIQRSNYQPHFILISKDDITENALRRLETISKETCGFKIAEEDLKLRGPGDFFGRLQHGLPDLRIANPLHDLEVLKEARIFAYRVIKNDPYLEKTGQRCLRECLFADEDNRGKI